MRVQLLRAFDLNTAPDSIAEFAIYSADEKSENFQELRVPVKSLSPDILDSLKKSQQLQDWVELQNLF